METGKAIDIAVGCVMGRRVAHEGRTENWIVFYTLRSHFYFQP